MKGKRKLLLVVIDAMDPGALDRAIQTGAAPALEQITHQGTYVRDCIPPFPSVTPVCAATLTTGTTLDQHRVPSMNWYHREEERYVELGTSVAATQKFGLVTTMAETTFNLNASHLASEVPTIFERMDDEDIRTALTTFLIYRGRHRHALTPTGSIAGFLSSKLSNGVMGPREFFYANMFASRKTPCRSQFGLPGLRDQHSGCVGAHLITEDLCDFLLLSLPDNDSHSHRNGLDSQVTSIAVADKQIQKAFDAAGGIEDFLDEYAIVVCSDHTQSDIQKTIDLFAEFEDFVIAQPREGTSRIFTSTPAQPEKEIAVCPGARSAQIFLLEDEKDLLHEVEERALVVEGVDLVMSLHGAPSQPEAVVRSAKGELRFAPSRSGRAIDRRGRRFDYEGDLAVLDIRVRDGVATSKSYPEPFGRIWDALIAPTTGEVLLSAQPGYEFLDWGRGHHIGGASHGSLHACDSTAVLTWLGVENEMVAPEQWMLQDVAPMVLNHFGLTNTATLQ